MLVPIIGMFIPIIAIVSTFTMIIFGIWFGSRQKEREAFYKAETLRRITESSGEGAKAAIELMKEDDRLKRIKRREGRKISGLILIAVGLGTVIFMIQLHSTDPGAPYLVGLVPAFIGAALLVYVYFLAGPVE